MHSSRCSRSVCTQYGSLKLVQTHVILAGVTCGPTRITNRRRCSSKAHNSRLAMLFWPRRTAFLLDLTIKCLLWPGGRNVNEQYSNFCNTVHSGDKNGGRAHNAATMIKAHPQHWTSLAQPASIRSDRGELASAGSRSQLAARVSASPVGGHTYRMHDPERIVVDLRAHQMSGRCPIQGAAVPPPGGGRRGWCRRAVRWPQVERTGRGIA